MNKDAILEKDGIKFRDINKEIFEYLKDEKNLIRKLYASRYKKIESLVDYRNLRFDSSNSNKTRIFSLEYLNPINDIEVGADILYKHIENNNRILYVSDFDADGVTSATVSHLVTQNVLQYDNFEVLVNRKEFGRGINNTLTDIIIDMYRDNPFSVIVTSDHGSSDRETLTRLKEELNIEIIVTDHHLFKDHKSVLGYVDAFINTQREDCTFSKNINGTVTVYFLLLYLYLKYYKESKKDTLDYLYYYISYLGLTTISDCMDLKDPLNRKFIKKGLEVINSKHIQHNAFWSLIRSKLGRSYFINENVLSYNLIPMLNTPGRIDNPRLSYKLMTTDSIDEAEDLYERLLILNDSRKNKQKKVYESDKHTIFSTDDIIVVLADESINIQGIVANNYLFQENYKIALVFATSLTEPDVLIGSGRMNDDDASLLQILNRVANKSDIIISHDGHDNALGIKIKNDLKRFFTELKEEVKVSNLSKQVKYDLIDEIIYSNNKLITSIFDIREASPFGIGFTHPTFFSAAELVSYRVIDKGKTTYLSGKIRLSEQSRFKISFFYTISLNEKDEFMENLKYYKKIKIIYNINVDNYFYKNKIHLNVIKFKFFKEKK